jgi:plastocyanin
MRLILAAVYVLVLIFSVNAQSLAEVSGFITFPDRNKIISKTKFYNVDGSHVMHSDDPMAKMENNIIVSLHNLSGNPKLTDIPEAIITQRQQTFIPHVLPVTKGTTVYLLNEDEFFHNIYSLTPGSRFNIGRKSPGNPYPIKIKKNGPIKLACDIHPHMSAIILSLDTPFFTRVRSDRSFKIDELPPGNYRLEVYHPELDKYTKEITIERGQKIEMELDLK